MSRLLTNSQQIVAVLTTTDIKTTRAWLGNTNGRRVEKDQYYINGITYQIVTEPSQLLDIEIKAYVTLGPWNSKMQEMVDEAKTRIR